MSDYMMSVKLNHGYESLKAEYSKKFPTLGNKPPLPTMTESDDDEENPGAPNTQKDDEIAALEKQVEESITVTEELRKKADSADQKYFHMKRSGDLAKNKITTATECLEMFLRDNLKKPNFKDIDPT